MIICDEKYPQILDKIAEILIDGDVELVFVDGNTMREINKTQRNVDKTTDVLSFPLTFVPKSILGSIVINLDLVREKSAFYGHCEDDEISLLFLHALLHIMGFDHENDNGEMRNKEKEIIAKFQLPKSLIVRTLDE